MQVALSLSKSFNEGPPWFALANASKTVRILVLCAASLMTALCSR